MKALPLPVAVLSDAEHDPVVRPFMPELDTIRGIAVLAVVFLHGFAWQYGNFRFSRGETIFVKLTQPGSLGVNLFFVLSGFLITGILLQVKDSTRFYSRFYLRRALRILPPYYLLLGLLWVLHSSSIEFLGLSFLYLGNLTSLFGVACGYGPLWSLAVEEHFYLIWPAVVRTLSRFWLTVVCSAIVAILPVLRFTCFKLNWGRDGLSWYTWFVADGLAAGALLSVIVRAKITRRDLRVLCGTLIILPSILGLAGQRFGIATRERPLGAALQQTTADVFFTGFLLLFLLVGASPHRRFVNNAVLRFFGHISYGLYLYHLLAFRIYDRIVGKYWSRILPTDYHFGYVLLRFVVSAILAVIFAYLSRTYFEERFLKLKEKLRRDVPGKSSAPLPDSNAEVLAAS